MIHVTAMLLSGGRTGSDAINQFGRPIPEYGNYRIVCLLSLDLVTSLSCVRRVRTSAWPSRDEALRGARGVLSMLSGMTIGVIFMLTDPPAYDQLSSESLAFVVLVTLILAFSLGCREIKSFLASPGTPPPPPVHSAPPGTPSP